MRSDQRSDAELLRSARTDPGAFALFYDRYEAAVVGYLASRVRNAEVAADLTAEAFAAMLGAAPRYKPEADTAAGWVFTIAHNTLAKSVRRGRVEARARARLGIRDAVSFDSDELDRVDALASTDPTLTDLLEQLPPDQASAIRARVLEERGYPEIAAELQTSPLVIRKRVSRGLATLRRGLEKEERQ